MSAAIYIQQVALWTPRYRSRDALRDRRNEAPPRSAGALPLVEHEGTSSSEPGAPNAELLPRRARGRASVLTALLAEVVQTATRDAQLALRDIPMLVGSAFGEIAITDQLLRMMHRDDRALSPARFQASVHNAAAGQISIALGSTGFSSCLAAGRATGAALLIEGFAWLATHGGFVLLAAADEPVPELIAETRYEPLALALLLGSEPDAQTLARIERPTPVSDPASPLAAELDPEGSLARNPVAPLLPLLDAVIQRRATSVVLPALTGSYRFVLTPYALTSHQGPS